MTNIFKVASYQVLVLPSEGPEDILQQLLKLDLVVKIVQKSYKAVSLPVFYRCNQALSGDLQIKIDDSSSFGVNPCHPYYYPAPP